uniref:Ycf34 n=1 Tax=Hommersandiophycus borowitzkae TaxID=268573 RepID=A0A1G4NUB3_9FLOR|nr:Hypothetical protein ycf34 [Hommersandiophycus borowitzkae]SCW22136.1 Hypothetical protein ycf34 [Hommersandiophycus borowitzkae]
MCICINCSYVHICSTYQFIKIQHNKETSETDNLFYPSHPVIHANLTDIETYLRVDWDVVECLSFLEQPGKWVHH